MMKQLLRARWVILLAGILACSEVANVRGQPGNARLRLDPPRIRLLYGRPGSKEVTDGKLRLRPNETRSAYLVLENPEEGTQQVRVELVQTGKDVPDTVYARADLTIESKSGPHKGLTPVTGWKLDTPPVAAVTAATPVAPCAAPPPPVPGLELEAPANAIEVRTYVVTLEGKDGKEERLTPLPGAPLRVAVSFLQPREYIEVPITAFAKDKLLTVQVRPNDQFRGPDCKVDLVIQPGDIPNLALPLENAALQGTIGTRSPRCELYAELRTRDGSAPTRGRYSLKIDGWDRAFVFDGVLGAPRPETEEKLRVVVAPFSARGEKLHLRVETDNIPSWANATVTTGLYRQGSDLPTVPADRIGAREARVRLQTATDGALVFASLVRDWEIDLDTRSVMGIFDLRTIVKFDGGQLSDNKTVVLDTTPPEGLQFVEPLEGARAIRGKTLDVQANGRDPQSQIDRVLFFFGKPADDRKPPANAIVATRSREDAPWRAKLLIPANAPKEPLPVSVVFFNKAGLAEFASITVVPEDAEVKDNKKPASISGRVVQGGDPKLGKLTVDDKATRPQAGAKVELRTARGTVATKETDDKGNYKFENVTPGAYTVFCLQGATNRRASENVEVKEFEQKTGVDLRLKR
jgi:hypothetical protein